MTRLVLTTALLATTVLGGCTKQFSRIEANTDATVQSQQRIEKQLSEIEDVAAQLREGESAREADYLELRAEMENQLRQLETLVQRMDARSEEQERLLREVLAALDLIARRAPSSQSMAAADTTASGAEPPVAGGSPGKDVFDAAWADYTRGDYGLARDGFQEVVDRFGRSELADDAEYWVAETWYAEHEFERARDGFTRMVRRWPDSELIPAAKLKLAYSLLETGDTEGAISTLRELRSSYPDSDEALIAGHKLSTLGDDSSAP
jgi:tol-pal system protein YbgF